MTVAPCVRPRRGVASVCSPEPSDRATSITSDVDAEAADHLGGIRAAVGLCHDLETGVGARRGHRGSYHLVVVTDHHRRQADATPCRAGREGG